MSLQIQSAVQLTIFVARRSLVTSGKFPEKHEHPQHRKTEIPRYKFKSNQKIHFELVPRDTGESDFLESEFLVEIGDIAC